MDIRESSLKDVVAVNKTVVEFGEPYSEEYFQDRISDKKSLVVVAYIDSKPAGYIVAYDKYEDGSFYCWMAGVDPSYRRQGVLTALMQYQEVWAKDQGYTKIRIRTRNNKRQMLANLVKKGFLFTNVEHRDDILENRIDLEKEIV